VVLVDTSVWVSHLHRGEAHLARLLDDAQVVTHSFIVGELACGQLKNRREILSLLQALPSVPTVSQEEVMYFIERHSLPGRGVGFIDAHLLASARLAGASLWTLDTPLKRVAEKLNLSYR